MERSKDFQGEWRRVSRLKQPVPLAKEVHRAGYLEN